MPWKYREGMKKSRMQARFQPAAGKRVDELFASSSGPVSVSVGKIVVAKRLRQLDRDQVAVIGESIRELGQTTPIWLRKMQYVSAEGQTSTSSVLIAGWHRLEAKKMLGEENIDAIYFDVDEQDALWLEISENADRVELSALEKAEHIHRKVQRIRARRRSEQKLKGGAQPADKAISAAASELGYSRDYVRRVGLVAEISEEAKVEVKKLGLANDARALRKIAKEKSPERQLATAKELGLKTLKSKSPISKITSTPRDEQSYEMLVASWRGSQCEQRFATATEVARRRFKRQLASLPSVRAEPKRRAEKREDWA